MVFGLVALVSYISGLMGDGLESQPRAMLLAALSLIGVGVIALPEVLDKLDTKKYKSIMMAGVALALGLGYAVFIQSLRKLNSEIRSRSLRHKLIQQLKDIRDIQLAHKSLRGTYAPDFDSLANFVRADVMPVTFNMGSFHDTLNEKRSAELGYIIKQVDLDSIAIELEITSDLLLKSIEEDKSPYKIRDTLYTSFFAENLTDQVRAGAKLPKFDLEAMPFNPRTGERFVMSTSAVEVGGLWQPTILVQDPTPFGRKSEEGYA